VTMTFPIAGFNRSGGVKTLVLLANAMAGGGWRVRLVVPDYGGNSPFVLAPQVDVRRIRTGFGPRVLRMAAFYVQLPVIAARDTDVFVANFYLSAYCACVLRVVNRCVRAVYFLQGDEAESHGRLADAPAVSRWLRYALARGSYRLPLPMLCVSEWLRRQVRRPDAVVVGQGIDLTVFRANGRERTHVRVVVGTIGSAAPVKGYDDVVAAASTLPEDACELLVVASEPVSLPSSIPSRLTSATTEDEMARFFNACDVFVFASHREGFGLPPLEAMASGCAVVTTDCGGVADYARHEENCLIVSPGDRQGLAAAIQRLISDPVLRERLASAAIRTAAMWPRERMTSAFMTHAAGTVA
jgi:glycosyltransferase involved in cell wall biosynthesis